MATPETFARALALWAQRGRRAKFSFAGDTLWPSMTETMEESVYAWLRDNRDPSRRTGVSAELATALQWWAAGATLDGEPLDIRARFKAIEFVLGLSTALPALLDNARPLLNVLQSAPFEALPDSALGDVPLKSALLSQAIAAIGAWCLSDDFAIDKYSTRDRQAAVDLVLYVSSLPVDAQDSLVCFAAVLCVCPRMLKVAIATLKTHLPALGTIEANEQKHAAVRIVLNRAAKAAEFEVIEALKGAQLHGYLELLDLIESATLVSGREMNIKPSQDNFVLESLVPRSRRLGLSQRMTAAAVPG